jgi:hypothetical protein
MVQDLRTEGNFLVPMAKVVWTERIYEVFRREQCLTGEEEDFLAASHQIPAIRGTSLLCEFKFDFFHLSKRVQLVHTVNNNNMNVWKTLGWAYHVPQRE